MVLGSIVGHSYVRGGGGVRSGGGGGGGRTGRQSTHFHCHFSPARAGVLAAADRACSTASPDGGDECPTWKGAPSARATASVPDSGLPVMTIRPRWTARW